MLREVVLLGRAGQRGGRFGGPPQDAGEQPGLRWACSAIDGPCGLLLALGDRPAAVSTLLDKAAAHVYKRPLGVFFLPEPPVDFDTMRDFRRHVGAKAGEWSPDLHGEYRRALTQRESALELAEIDDAPPPTTWRLTALPTNDEALASVARDMLLSQSPLGLPGGGGTKYEHLNVWVAALEEAGVLVLATSGGKVLTTEMRAFSLYFDILPVIMVNGSDAGSTVLAPPRVRPPAPAHRRAVRHGHRRSGHDARPAVRGQMQRHRRCYADAARCGSEQSRSGGAQGCPLQSWNYQALRDAAAPFGASAEAFARRLLTLGRINQDFYQAQRACALGVGVTALLYLFDTSSLLNGRRGLLPPKVFPTLGQDRAVDQ